MGRRKKAFSDISDNNLKKRKKGKQPNFIKPMLATLTQDYFSDKNWIYEHKFDGVRCIIVKKDGKVSLKTRNKNKVNKKYPEISDAFKKQKSDNFIIDGEIVALNKKGLSDFKLLQSRINLEDFSEISKKDNIKFCAFDVMYFDKYDLQKLSLTSRKKILKNLLNYNKTILYTKDHSPDGKKYYKQACKEGWEGIIAKKADSTYLNSRSKKWLKFKCTAEQEFVIVGYTEPQGSITDFGALLIGYYKNDKLIYAGKVGTGYTDKERKTLGKKLRKLETGKINIKDYDKSEKGVHWIKPKLVANIKFAEWTKANKLRVPRYKGLREDKDPKKVKKETAK